MTLLAVTSPSVASSSVAEPVGPQLFERLEALAVEARAAFVYSPVYWSHARDRGYHAAELGAKLLPDLTGRPREFVVQGLAYLDKANATWGTTAKEPYWMASGLLRTAVETMQGYHQPEPEMAATAVEGA